MTTKAMKGSTADEAIVRVPINSIEVLPHEDGRGPVDVQVQDDRVKLADLKTYVDRRATGLMLWNGLKWVCMSPENDAFKVKSDMVKYKIHISDEKKTMADRVNYVAVNVPGNVMNIMRELDANKLQGHKKTRDAPKGKASRTKTTSHEEVENSCGERGQKNRSGVKVVENVAEGKKNGGGSTGKSRKRKIGILWYHKKRSQNRNKKISRKELVLEIDPAKHPSIDDVKKIAVAEFRKMMPEEEFQVMLDNSSVELTTAKFKKLEDVLTHASNNNFYDYVVACAIGRHKAKFNLVTIDECHDEIIQQDKDTTENNFVSASSSVAGHEILAKQKVKKTSEGVELGIQRAQDDCNGGMAPTVDALAKLVRNQPIDIDELTLSPPRKMFKMESSIVLMSANEERIVVPESDKSFHEVVLISSDENSKTPSPIDDDRVSEWDNLSLSDIERMRVPMVKLIDNSKLEISREIGRGSYGTVFEAIHVAGNYRVALKTFDKRVIQMKLVKNEIMTMRKCKHPNVVKLIGIFERNQFPSIVMEYVDGENYGRYLMGWVIGLDLSKSDRINICKHLVTAIKYLHAINIIHNDVKPANVVIDRRTKNAKLCDFGLAEVLSSGDDVYNEPLPSGWERRGTPIYMAPEVHQRRRRNSKKSEMWSVGIFFVESFIMGQYAWAIPREREVESELASNFALGKVPDYLGLPNFLITPVSWTFKYPPAQRTTAEQLLRAFKYQPPPSEEDAVKRWLMSES